MGKRKRVGNPRARRSQKRRRYNTKYHEGVNKLYQSDRLASERAEADAYADDQKQNQGDSHEQER